jgi:NitT/TauT family transport system substrate-binding protein
MSRQTRLRLAAPLALVAVVSSAACATSSSDAQPPASADTSATATSTAGELRLGYFANITHATAVYGVGSGAFQQALGDTKLKTQVFNAGPAP